MFGDALRDLFDPRMRGSALKFDLKDAVGGGNHATEKEPRRPGRGRLCTGAAAGRRAPLADTDTPKYGGTLEIGTVYPTLSALSWDLRTTGTGSRTTTPASSTSSCSPPISRRASRTVARIPSTPTPGCPPTPSAASWPRAGSGRTIRCASRSSCARASCSRTSPASCRRASSSPTTWSSATPGSPPARTRSPPTSTTSPRWTRPTSTPSSSQFNGYFAEWDYRFG